RTDPGVLHSEIADHYFVRVRTIDRLAAPLICVVADGDDQLVFRHQLERLLNVADEETVTGDRPCLALGLVLVIIHQDQPVGVGGEKPVIEVIVICGDVDKNLHPLRVQVGGELRDKSVEAGLRAAREIFEIDGNAAKIFVGGEKPQKLPAKIRATIGIVKEVANRRQPFAGNRIEVVDQRKYFGVCLLVADQ